MITKVRYNYSNINMAIVKISLSTILSLLILLFGNVCFSRSLLKMILGFLDVLILYVSPLIDINLLNQCLVKVPDLLNIHSNNWNF